MTFYSLWQPAVDQLNAAGYDQQSLRAILLTHSRSDHVSGLPDFPGVPVWVTPQECEFIRKGGNGQFGKPFAGIRYEEYGFEGGPYLGFPCSHNVYGDGSIEVGPAPGHTPGGAQRDSFQLPDEVADKCVARSEERPWISRKLADSDAEGNRQNLLRMVALEERLPELIVVPAHDMRVFAEMPTLSRKQQDRR